MNFFRVIRIVTTCVLAPVYGYVLGSFWFGHYGAFGGNLDAKDAMTAFILGALIGFLGLVTIVGMWEATK